MSDARGIIFTDLGSLGALAGILPPISAQGATFALVDRQIRAPQLDKVLARLCDDWGQLDFLIHCAMPAGTGLQGGPYVDTDVAAFQAAMACCVHRFAEIAGHARHVMGPGGSLLSLNWPSTDRPRQDQGLFDVVCAAQAASVRCLAQDLGTKGLRVNAIAGGPLRNTAPDRGGSRLALPIAGRHRAPLRRDVTPEEIGKAAVYLLSALSSGTTGVTLHVDAGHHVIGLRSIAPR
ncbi:MAG: SDR family oxidoreductase [Pararhodobacter sp.]|nr:SDR family oxidoreductase [Pararhodobacter sp.]